MSNDSIPYIYLRACRYIHIAFLPFCLFVLEILRTTIWRRSLPFPDPQEPFRIWVRNPTKVMMLPTKASRSLAWRWTKLCRLFWDSSIIAATRRPRWWDTDRAHIWDDERVNKGVTSAISFVYLLPFNNLSAHGWKRVSTLVRFRSETCGHAQVK